ncbi:hypothetical protein EVAR_53331_1 [Eumeta japonica]|uniref:Uncharacterized protein n=1 Tax=Eumeta variegata TaxID=151549 RepID=A0A4C1XAA0_EUMVA|nr:hypothetical protein EVAR_53331_1 [Eumeta japonica]
MRLNNTSEHSPKMLHLCPKRTGRIDRILPTNILTVRDTRCDLEARVDIGVPKPRGDKSTLDEVNPVPYEGTLQLSTVNETLRMCFEF